MKTKLLMLLSILLLAACSDNPAPTGVPLDRTTTNAELRPTKRPQFPGVSAFSGRDLVEYTSILTYWYDHKTTILAANRLQREDASRTAWEDPCLALGLPPEVEGQCLNFQEFQQGLGWQASRYLPRTCGDTPDPTNQVYTPDRVEDIRALCDMFHVDMRASGLEDRVVAAANLRTRLQPGSKGTILAILVITDEISGLDTHNHSGCTNGNCPDTAEDKDIWEAMGAALMGEGASVVLQWAGCHPVVRYGLVVFSAVGGMEMASDCYDWYCENNAPWTEETYMTEFDPPFYGEFPTGYTLSPDDPLRFIP